MTYVQNRNSSTKYGYSDLRAFLWPMLLSLLLGVLTLVFLEHVPGWMHYLPREIAGIISGIDGIALSSRHPSQVILIMGYQWLFLPWYAAVSFIKFSPWKKEIRVATAAKAATLQPGQRILAALAVIYFLTYVLGDFGVVPVPTMINASWAYPRDNITFFLQPIYRSNVMLMIYAWISPICETLVWWMLINMLINIEAYLGLRSSSEGTQ